MTAKNERAVRELPPVDESKSHDASALAETAPLPARISNIRLGTAGFTDRTLIESRSFYPRGVTSSEARLRHYAAHFPLVEIDATYYSLLPPSSAERWTQNTPPDFRIDVKAFPLFTEHPIDVRKLPQDLRQPLVSLGHEQRVYPKDLPPELAAEMANRFLALLEPLRAAGKLGAVLLQFPPWFTATRGNAQRIEALRTAYPQVPFAVEFRHGSWFESARQERVFSLLARHAMSYVSVDQPNLPFLPAVTHPELAYLRFHGHNVEGFGKRGASVIERFCYLYSPQELAPWVAPVRRLAGNAREVHVLFNNCVRNFAVLGAKDLAALLAQEPSSALSRAETVSDGGAPC
ncbi:MAG TPA: DUF72 domain-containing protein [Polyangiaceae bacterium]|nr:DUF72 domain-containing protein [Polyangiaceae bacterium]